MEVIYAEAGKPQKEVILNFIDHFEFEGEPLDNGERNSIKIFDLKDKKLNIKSFKVPNVINRITYRFFRKSKAERSFKYAQYLLSKNIGTPTPYAYAEETSALTFGRSFYVSEHLVCDLTYRELVLQPNFPNHEKILRAFVRFSFKLHENNIEFLDHSPGNTLIKLKEHEDPEFFLVDLNRMNFRKLDLDARMKNLSRLTPKKEMVEVMASEYAKLLDKPEALVFDKMWFYTNKFQEKYLRKQALKKKFKR